MKLFVCLSSADLGSYLCAADVRFSMSYCRCGNGV